MKRFASSTLALRLALALAVALGVPGLAWAGDVVSGSVTPGVQIVDINTLGSGQKVTTSVKLPDGFAPISFANGTTAGQVSVQWTDTRTYSATPTTLDLTALTSASTNTGAASFTKVKIMAIYNNEAADSGKDIIISGGATNPFTGPLGGTAPTYTVKAGTAWVFFDVSTAGAAVSGTAKTLKLDPGANNVSCSVIFAGN